MNPITVAWLAEVGIISWRSVKNNARPPLPSELLATFIVFGGLSLLANNPKAAQIANITAGGFVIATLLNFFDPATGKPYGASTNTTAPSVASVTPQNPKG